MPFWKNYIYTKPEVDDDDLPQAEYRLFDDEGRMRDDNVAAMAATAWRRSSTSSKASANAKKSPPLSQKKHASLLKSVGAKLTTPLKEADLKDSSHSPSKAASRSPHASKLAARSPAKSPARANSPEPQPMTSASSTPRKTSPKKAPPKKISPKKSSSKQSSPKKAASRSPARARSPSPTKPKPAAKTSARRRRSRSRSNSRRKAATAPSKTPSPKWTLAALKEFAKDNSIQLKGVKTKADILSAINGSP
ncbi:hypothetical protein conserved [Leishmania donovani]|nr:hypothetical protein CGC21_27685 [Leishmania donovani]CAC9506876.1 hypothetical_protein_-_conserved [Leishmania infantum]CAJ1990497.1 hypothetical protein conserved [Leishmania donovani]SUZ43526.1 hypothetical_protein_-_conserved [Leishmania infantum]VDZ46352.1 hypothetical_protein_conserved [Leishmania donovani]